MEINTVSEYEMRTSKLNILLAKVLVFRPKLANNPTYKAFLITQLFLLNFINTSNFRSTEGICRRHILERNGRPFVRFLQKVADPWT